jgi:hypothetical protein
MLASWRYLGGVAEGRIYLDELFAGCCCTALQLFWGPQTLDGVPKIPARPQLWSQLMIDV